MTDFLCLMWDGFLNASSRMQKPVIFKTHALTFSFLAVPFAVSKYPLFASLNAGNALLNQFRVIMTERAYYLDGKLDIIPRRQGGTRVRLLFSPKK